jgi:ribosomal protein S9
LPVELVRGTGKFTINTIPGIDICNKKQTYFCYSSPIRFISAKELMLMLWVVLVGQADAITLAIARALCKIDQAYRGS